MTMNMSRADAERWYAARSLTDLGQLTAAWLEGELESQPGYVPGNGPDEETNELVPILAAVNRAGYLTMCSQPATSRSSATTAGPGRSERPSTGSSTPTLPRIS
ncbi:hypothetical protein BAY61_31770 (plasmid) [Prauserella marina]|uniref:DUF6919 domain-containing protein n=1 Tax=Prauserella marina TaxID=530584 RepID=A0A222W0Y2_9PSEU|nr:hypothetical protein [Prauserella marina]ASR39866.1 hypothetical protein BAY61_31770 [Prauserella marina]PWV71358.1 hypothetical protein DES30_11274 [Prauserella marina]SDD95866.1 hypothetical protein SAMN05421630_11538 [Prauserella marina]